MDPVPPLPLTSSAARGPELALMDTVCHRYSEERHGVLRVEGGSASMPIREGSV